MSRNVVGEIHAKRARYDSSLDTPQSASSAAELKKYKDAMVIANIESQVADVKDCYCDCIEVIIEKFVGDRLVAAGNVQDAQAVDACDGLYWQVEDNFNMHSVFKQATADADKDPNYIFFVGKEDLGGWYIADHLFYDFKHNDGANAVFLSSSSCRLHSIIC